MQRRLSFPWPMQSGYLSGPIYDHVLIFGVLILAVVSGMIVYWRPELFIPVLIVDLWLLGYHHVMATFTKLAGTRQDRRENRFLIFYLPFLVLASVLLLNQVLGIWSIVTIYFFWQWFHYVRQDYGISAFYRRKSGIKNTITPQRLDYVAFWSIPVWGLVHRCAQGWETFLFQPVWMPHLPAWFDITVGVAACSILLLWITLKVFDWAQNNLAYAPFFFVLSHHVTFFIGYIYIKDLTIGWLVANIWHNAQYILFVWLFNQNRFKKPETRAQSPLLYWLCQRSPYRTFAYFALCLGITTFVYGSLDLSVELISGDDAVAITAITVVLYQAINFHHYIVDSLIWKARKKTHQDIMKVND